MPARPRPPASVVIATRDREALAAAAVARIVAQLGGDDELLVVDAGGGDLATFVESFGTRARHLQTEPGKTTQLNAGARAARGEVLVLTDDDVDAPPGWVDAMASAFTGSSRLGAVFGPVVGLTSVPGGTPAPVVPPGPAPVELWTYAHGASMAVRRDALLAIGGFDERLGPGGAVGHGEEGDVVRRLLEAGWTIGVADAPAVQHVDWRTDEQHASNLRVYERGAGHWVGAALRRAPASSLKVAALRARYQAALFADARTRGLLFGPRSAAAFAGGVVRGLRMAPRRFLEPPVDGDDGGGRRARPRLLWVTAEVPDRALGGGHIRQAHLVEGLGERFDVTVLSAGRVDDARVRAAADIVEVAPGRVVEPGVHTVQRVRNLWATLVLRQPLEVYVGRRHRRSLLPLFTRLVPTSDVVAVNHQVLYPMLERVHGPLRVLETHNVAAVRARQHAAVAAGRRRRWWWGHQAKVSRRFEDRAVAGADVVVACSDEDAAALGAGEVVVAPNGVDLDVHAPSPLPTAPVIALTATLDYAPNVDGATWFVEEVLPAVTAAVPEASVVLVGRRPAPAVTDLASRPGVELHRDVPSVVPFVRAARVCVVPLRVGSGTRLKALEYLAAGRPVVGTSIGLAGLGLRSGEHALVADSPAAFATAVTEVLLDDELARRLAVAGRDHVARSFSWSEITRCHADALAEALAARLRG